MSPQINLSLPEGVSQSWQSVKNFVNQGVDSVSNSAEQFRQSLPETATTAIEQAKSSIGQSWQTADQFKNTTSRAMETAIASSFNDWLTEHPVMSNLLQIINWAANHPIISLVVLLFSLAVIFSIINAIIRWFTTATFSILQAPIKLIAALFKFSIFTFRKLTNHQQINKTSALLANHVPNLEQEKQQRLAEISGRLIAIQQEQKQLLQEASEIIATNTAKF